MATVVSVVDVLLGVVVVIVVVGGVVVADHINI